MSSSVLRSVVLRDTTALQLLGGFSIPDALAFSHTCRTSNLGVKRFSAALGFAQTRPVFSEAFGFPGRPARRQSCLELGRSVAWWAELWEQCAKSVEASGLDGRAWLCACTQIDFSRGRPNSEHAEYTEHFEEEYGEYDGLDDFEDFDDYSGPYEVKRSVRSVKYVSFMDRFFEAMQTNMHGGSGAKAYAVLYVDSVRAENGDGWGRDTYEIQNVLVALTDGRLAWAVLEHHFFSWMDDVEQATRCADLFVAQDLPQVLVDANVSWYMCEGRLHGDRGERAAKWTYCETQGKVSCNLMASQEPPKYFGDLVPPQFGEELASPMVHSADMLLQLAHFRHVVADQRERCVRATEEVTHHDPPAHVDPEVAQSLVRTEEDEAFAQIVERRLRVPEVPHTPSPVFNILTYRSGKGELFRKMLLEDNELKSLRGQLCDRGLRLDLPGGALVLVHPDHYHAVLYKAHAHKLKRYSLIIEVFDEYLLDQVLSRLSSKRRPRENRQERQKIEIMTTFINKRTFLCSVPALGAASAVAQSTTEAQRSSGASSSNFYAHARGGNPRRRHAW